MLKFETVECNEPIPYFKYAFISYAIYNIYIKTLKTEN